MLTASSESFRSFHRLERALVRRRIEAIDPLLRLEVAALATLSAGFVFWQARIPLHAQVRDAGPIAFAVAAAVTWVFLGVLAAGLAGTGMARSLRAGPDGPPWLHLPIESQTIARHLEWNARGQAFPLLVPAAGFMVAGLDLVPWWWLPLIAATGIAVLFTGAALGSRLAVRFVAAGLPGTHLPPLVRALAARGPVAARRGVPGARWRSGPPWLAIWRKDRRLLARASRARRMFPAAVGFAILSLFAWRLPADVHLERFAAFALALLAAAAFAEWLVEITGSDPFAVLRHLPVGLADVWSARALWVACGAVSLVAAHTLASLAVTGVANPVFLVWLFLATLCIGLLGVHYGITLFGRTEDATRMLALSLGLAVAGSIMIPMVGWLLLLTAVLHSTRRLHRWSRLEDL